MSPDRQGINAPIEQTIMSAAIARGIAELFDLRRTYAHLDGPVAAKKERFTTEDTYSGDEEMYAAMTDIRMGPAETELYEMTGTLAHGGGDDDDSADDDDDDDNDDNETEAYCQCSGTQTALTSTEAYCQCSGTQTALSSSEAYCQCSGTHTALSSSEAYCQCSGTQTGMETEAFVMEPSEAYCECEES